MQPPLGVELAVTGPEHIDRKLVHLGQDVALEADIDVGVELVKEGLELVVAELVAWLELAVVFAPLLDSVVGKVDEFVAEVVDAVLSA